MRRALEHLVYRDCVSNKVVMLYCRNDQHMSRNQTGVDLKVINSMILAKNQDIVSAASASSFGFEVEFPMFH